MDAIEALDRGGGTGGMASGPGFEGLLGESAPMQALRREIEGIAPVDVPVLILGETGTGKELVARALHTRSPRHAKSLQPVHCGALPRDLLPSTLFGHEKGAFTGAVESRKGLLRAAAGGTVFLDEIGELTPEAQVMLLRFLQEGEVQPVGASKPEPVDARILAATHRDLAAWVDQGQFREDLYQRLCWAVIEVPPLRARPEDLPALVEHFRERFNTRFSLTVEGITPATLEWLSARPWPGNVRELETLMARTMLRCRTGWIAPEHLHFGPSRSRRSESAPTAGPRPQPVATPPRRPRREVALELARHPQGVASSQLAAACGVSAELARLELVALAREGRLQRVGIGRGTRYVRPAAAEAKA
jgi:DNA-binding NtrC family response regulator